MKKLKKIERKGGLRSLSDLFRILAPEVASASHRLR